MKKTVLFLIIICLTIGACGCMWNRGEKNKVDTMVKYMNEKYTDDVFTYKGPFGGGAGVETKTIVVSSKNHPNKDIYVRQNPNEDNVCTDNYLSVQYENQTESMIKGVLDRALSYDYHLFYEVDRYACPNPVGTLTFEEYVASSASSIGFTVVVNGTVSDQDLFEKVFEEALIDVGACCSGTVYFDSGSGTFDTLGSDGLSRYTFKKLYSGVFSFDMSNNKGFSTARWGD